MTKKAVPGNNNKKALIAAGVLLVLLAAAVGVYLAFFSSSDATPAPPGGASDRSGDGNSFAGAPVLPGGIDSPFPDAPDPSPPVDPAPVDPAPVDPAIPTPPAPPTLPAPLPADCRAFGETILCESEHYIISLADGKFGAGLAGKDASGVVLAAPDVAPLAQDQWWIRHTGDGEIEFRRVPDGKVLGPDGANVGGGGHRPVQWKEWNGGKWAVKTTAVPGEVRLEAVDDGGALNYGMCSSTPNPVHPETPTTSYHPDFALGVGDRDCGTGAPSDGWRVSDTFVRHAAWRFTAIAPPSGPSCAIM